ncbi:MAG: translation initiation factor IF-2 subunit alpha [archaeon]
MFFKRSGFPEEGELVICTVNKILFHSVFVSIDEYRALEGMLHISEVAPGRIRNLRDYVREGKQIICKVIRINEQKGHIDLSLRRVNPSARSKKLNEYKQEEKAEKILEHVAKSLKTDLEDVYKKAGERIIDDYGLLSSCFQDIVLNGESVLEPLKIPGEYVGAIVAEVKERISVPEAIVSCYLTLQSFSDDGVVVIRDILAKATEFAKKEGIDVVITYVSAPRYQLDVKEVSYKGADEKLLRVVDFIVKQMVAAGGSAEFSKK